MASLFKFKRYNSVAVDPEETIEQGFRKDFNYSKESGDHDYGSFCLPGNYNPSLIEKGKRGYWTGKQYIRELLGRDDDLFSIASDADGEKQAQRARHIQKNCLALSKALRRYQKINEKISSGEMALSALLRACSCRDVGDSGDSLPACAELMSRLSTVMESSALSRMDFDIPLARFFQQVEALRGRGLTDTLSAVKKMSNDRTSFRGAMLWMTDAARRLSDPDAPKQLEKYRQAQLMVRDSKKAFEQSNDAVFVKVDMLASSLCTMLSSAMLPYEEGLINQWNYARRDYGELLRFSRESMRHQYRLKRDIERERQRMAESEEPECNLAAESRDAWAEERLVEIAAKQAVSETWNNTNSLHPAPQSASMSNLSSREIQEELMRLAQVGVDCSLQPSDDQTKILAEHAWEMAGDIELVEQAKGEDDIWQITGDEGQLETLFPMSHSLRQRQEKDLQAEAAVENELADLIGSLDLFPADSSESKEGVSSAEGATPMEDDLWQFMVSAAKDVGTDLPASVLDLTSGPDAFNATKSAATCPPSNKGDNTAPSSPPRTGAGSVARSFLGKILQKAPEGMQPKKGRNIKSVATSSMHDAWVNLFADIDPLANPDGKLSNETLKENTF